MVAEAIGAPLSVVEETHTPWELRMWVEFLVWKNAPAEKRPKGPQP